MMQTERASLRVAVSNDRWRSVMPAPRPGSEPLAVALIADDPVSRAGMASQLRDTDGVTLLSEAQRAEHCDVAVVTGDALDDTLCQKVRRLRRDGAMRVLLCVSSIDEAGLFAAVEAGACGVIRRAEATPERLTRALRSAASGDGSLPPDLLGRLLEHVQSLSTGLLAPRGLRLSGLTERETDVLRLIADGFDTKEIAARLCYSERTVKNVIHDMTTRLQLRNRAHAVAYAVRQGLI